MLVVVLSIAHRGIAALRHCVGTHCALRGEVLRIAQSCIAALRGNILRIAQRGITHYAGGSCRRRLQPAPFAAGNRRRQPSRRRQPTGAGNRRWQPATGAGAVLLLGSDYMIILYCISSFNDLLCRGCLNIGVCIYIYILYYIYIIYIILYIYYIFYIYVYV